MKLRVTENNKFLRLYEAQELELEQLEFSFRKRIRGHFYHPKIKIMSKKYEKFTKCDRSDPNDSVEQKKLNKAKEDKEKKMSDEEKKFYKKK